jgi:hypothetical protein
MLKQYYNKETNTLRLPYYFNEELCDLPINTKVIIFEENCYKNQFSQFNQPVGHQGCKKINCPRNLPNSITHLTFGYDFNKRVDNLPNSITHLTLGFEFNKPFNNLPNSITHLTFGGFFNKPVGHQGCGDIKCPRNLPNSITHLAFGGAFNNSIDNLPNSITHLTFGMLFNEPANNLPNSITHLSFGYNFNQKLDNLPINVQEINFNYDDEKKIFLILKKVPFGCKILNENKNVILD